LPDRAAPARPAPSRLRAGRPALLDVTFDLYQAVAGGDLEAVRACFRDDALWILPGKSPIAGEHRGWEAIPSDQYAFDAFWS
jgi:ketosteroid isomerase-like protein